MSDPQPKNEKNLITSLLTNVIINKINKPMKRKLLFAMLCIVSVFGGGKALAQFTNEEGKYVLQNVGSGRYLGPSNSWGTQASLLPSSHYNILHSVVGGYQIETQVSNGGTQYYFNGSYMDNGSPVTVTFTDNGAGLYTMTSDGSTYYGYDGSSTVLASNLTDPTSANALWKVMAYDEVYANASEENPADLTYMILDANFDRNHRNASAWTMEASNQNLSGGTNENRCAESWRAAFTLSQTISVPNGVYELTAQAALTEYSVTGADFPVVYANDATAPFKTMQNGENSMSVMSAQFSNGNYVVGPIRVVVTNGSLTVGVRGTRTDTWCIWDNFQLKYYGMDLSALRDALQAQIDAVADLEGTTTTAAYNDVKSYADAINVNALTTEEAISAASTELTNRINAAKALSTSYTRYQSVKSSALAIAPALDVAAVAAEVEAATTTEEIETAIPVIRQALLAELPNVEIPVDPGYIDVTNALVDNPTVRKNTDYWTIYNYEGYPTAGNSNGVTNYEETEFYRQQFKFYQTLSLVTGTWEFGVTGFHRAGNYSTYFYAGDDQILVPGVGSGVVNSMEEAKGYFDAGNGKVSLKFALEEDADIEIGINNQDDGSTDKWTIFRDFTLKYYGPVDYSGYVERLNEALDRLQALDVPTAVKANVNALDDEYRDADLPNKTAYNAAIGEVEAMIADLAPIVASYAEYKTMKASVLALADDTEAYTGDAVVSTTEADEAVEAATTVEAVAAAEGLLRSAAKAFIDAVTLNEGKVFDITDIWVVNPSFENGLTGWTNEGMQTQNNEAFEKVGEYYCEAWIPNGNKSVKQSLTLLNSGYYRLSAKVKARGVDSAKLFANGIEEYITVEDATETYTIDFVSDANAEIEIGFEGTGTGAGSSWLCVDDFHLTYVGALPNVTAVTGNMNADVAAAQTAAINAYNAGKSIAGYDAALAAIAAAQASVDAYAKVRPAIEKVNALKAVHNFASAEAAATFTEAASNVWTAYEAGTLTDAEANAAGVTLGVEVTDWHANPNGAAVNYLESGFGLNDYDAALHVNTWSVEGDKDGSNFSVPFYEYWTSDANSLDEKTWTGTLTDLPNGLYKVSAWVRVRANDDTEVTNATGITMTVNDGDAVDVTEGVQVLDGQFNIATYEAQGLVKDGTLALSFNVAADNNISWLAFKNLYYTKVRDLTPEEMFVPATDEDYAALNAAIEAAEGKTFGFDAGDYAPYNNVDAVTAFAAAKAIDQEAENAQEDVQAATATLTAAWVENETEVNAVFDGSFEHDYSGQTGNINPIGWQRVKGAAADGYNVRLMNGSNAGLAATTSGKALFTKQSAYYGYAEGYDMPLKANTYYKVTFIYGGWGDCKKDGYVNVVAPDGSAVALSATELPVDATNADSDPSVWKSYEAIFQTGEAGDYVLGLRKHNYDTSGQSQYVYGDIRLVRATVADLRGLLLAEEITTASGLSNGANVGEGAFQIPTAAATAFANSVAAAQGVYRDNEATIDDVLQAIADLKAAEEAYSNVTLNAPAEDKVYNIINNSEGYNYKGNAVTFKSAEDADLSDNTTSMGYNEAPGSIYPQGVTFTAVEGVKNGYILSYTRADGQVVYVGTGSTTGLGSNNYQIRPTTDEAKAVTIQVVATATEGIWNLVNTLTGSPIGANGASDQGFYTTNQFSSMTLQEAVETTVPVAVYSGNFATLIVPFDAEKPEGTYLYTITGVEDGEAVLADAKSIQANTPYLLYSKSESVETQLSGMGSAYTDALYTEGLLTGVYVAGMVPTNAYAFNNDSEPGFYLVTDDAAEIAAFTAYLVAPEGVIDDVITLPEDPTALSGIEPAATDNDVRYNLAGQRVNRSVKGIIIINGRKQLVK